MDDEQLLNIATEVGYLLLASGAEIYRVEESVERILLAYGVEEADAFAIPSSLIVTVRREGMTHTQLRRVHDRGLDLSRVQRYNDLCRRICRDTPGLPAVLQELEAIKATPRRGLPMQVLATALSSGAFAPFFGGSLPDALCAALIGAALRLLLWQMDRFRANSFFINIIASGFSAAMAVLAVRAGLGRQVDKIVIAAFMNLVPGVAMTNAIRDIIAGDLVAGLTKLTEALLTAIAMALGAGIAIAVTGYTP